ncbi:LPXTG-motif cell wall anchor domain protein [Gleimia coleocanis DSM 15436]|uniref:LPXTG-motif cell wall anchor domain protein n=1 Tax=Gleimia coleocanis DSM 15436 TaxID=525245 RepID=C0VY35_9ACTO|nr:fibronectin type III domain-containing protein [Gleimia coleocanis]EEH64338.1 LPXTG-motif cell wall anchor domain protein [Gleimia coleocanis DSM 15436]
MKMRLRKNSQNLLRSGLVTATAGALLFSMATPVFATETNGETSTFAAVSTQPSAHPQAAKNVTVEVVGKQITVNWERAASHRGNYRVAVYQGNRPVLASYHFNGPVNVNTATLQTNVDYYVTVAPMDSWDIDIITGSSVLSDYFKLTEETAPVNPGTPNPAQPGTGTPGGGEPGSEGSGGSEEAPKVAVPSVPVGLSARLAVKDSTGIESYWFEPENGKPITNYDIQLVGSDGSTVDAKADMTSDAPEFANFKGLKPGVSYQVKVRAENKGGWGPWTELSAPVVIPANQDAFRMQIDKEGFGVFESADHRFATVSWTQTGYEPEHSVYLVRILCVQACGADFKSHFEQFDARGLNTNWKLDKLPAGVFKAQLKLIHGKLQSEVAESEPFVIGVPKEIKATELSVTPTTDIDPAKDNTFKVTGTGYTGPAADKGVYVVVTEPSVWTPGKNPDPKRINQFLVADWVMPGNIKDGNFTTTITVPAGKFKPGKQYFVGTMAAHALSLVERDLDKQVNLTLKQAEASAPKPTDPVTPKPEIPGNQPETPGTQPGTPGTQPENPGTQPGTPEQPETPAQPQPPVVDPAVKVAVSAAGTPVSSFTEGEEITLDLDFTGVEEGSSWSVVLHSDPVSLGTVTVMGGKAVLKINTETAALLVAGDHTLKFTQVGTLTPKLIELPWKVVAKAVTPAPANPVPSQLTPAPQKPAPAPTQPAPALANPAPQASGNPGPQSKGTLPNTGADSAALLLASITLLGGGLLALRSRKRLS